MSVPPAMPYPPNAGAPGLLGRLRSVLGPLARRSSPIAPGAYVGATLGAPVLSGISVTPQSALALTAYYCGVNTISGDVAKLPLNLYRRLPKGGQKVVADDPRNRLVSARPNDRMTGMRRRQAEMGHTLGWGNGYTQVVRGPDGMPTALWPLHPGTVRPVEDGDGGGLLYEDTQTRKKYRAEDVIHVAGLGFDGLSGYSPVALARQAIGLGIAVEQFGAALFGNGAIPKGALQTPKKLSETAAKRLRETFHEVHGGTWNAHKTMVLEEGLEWVNTQINPDDAQFLLTRQFQVLEVARMLNLPPNKLQDYSQSHLANVEESNLDYATNTLTFWLEAIEAEYNAKLLFDDERDRLFFQHDLNALLRGNMAARSGFHKTLFTIGAETPNEIRAALGLNPIKLPNADKPYLQAQFVPLDRAGEAMAAKAGAPAGPAPDPKPDPEDPNGDEPQVTP